MWFNMGKWDRGIRALVGLGILFFVPQTPWAWIGLLPLVTAITGVCPLYRLFGWSTKTQEATAQPR